MLHKPIDRYNSYNQGTRDILTILMTAAFLIILSQIMGIRLMSDFLVYTIMVLGLDLLFGYMGQLTFGTMLFFGTGTYASTLFYEHVSQHPFLGIIAGVLAGALVALIVGAITIRLRGPVFAMANMGLNYVGFFIVAYPFPQITGGEDGMSVPVGPLFGDFFITRQPTLFIFILICTLLVIFFLRKYTTSPMGVLTRGMAANDERIRHLGYNLHYYRLITFIVAMSTIAFAGTLNAINYRYIAPAFIDTDRNVEVIFAVLIGGRAKGVVGALLGGLIYMTLREYVSVHLDRWEMVLGLALIATAFWFREGVMGFIQNNIIDKLSGKEETKIREEDVTGKESGTE